MVYEDVTIIKKTWSNSIFKSKEFAINNIEELENIHNFVMNHFEKY